MHEVDRDVRAMSTPASRLKLAREKAGFPQPVDAANSLGVNRFTYVQHENGTRGFPKDRAVQYAKKFKVSLEWLLTGRGNPGGPNRDNEALVVGYVGAGAEVIRFEEGVVLEAVEAPPWAEGANVAKVRGESMPPLRDGWLIYYGPEHQGIPERCIGELSVCGLKDGTTLIKVLHKGSKKHLWDLESWNGPLRRDQPVIWAALVLDIRPH